MPTVKRSRNPPRKVPAGPDEQVNQKQEPLPVRLPWRRVVMFVVIASVVYFAFVLAWPMVGHGYGVAYRGCARTLLGQFDGDIVEFRPTKTRVNMDTEIRVNRRHVPVAGRCFHSTRVIGYLTTAEFVALVVATPVTWRRRLIALLVGLSVVHVYILLRVVMVIVWLYGTPDAPFAKYDFGTRGWHVVTWLHEAIVGSLNGTFFGPVAIWIAVTIRVNDVRALMAGEPTTWKRKSETL